MATRFKSCSVQNCNGNSHRDGEGKRGFCSKHYQRWQHHGDPNIIRGVPSPAMDWLHHQMHTKDKACLVWPFHTGANGYGRAHSPKNGVLTNASRIMCELAHGAPPSDIHEAAHSCGNGSKGCVNPNHLDWATPADNHADKLRHGTHNRGERHGASKLTENDVRKIRALIGTTSQAAIARMFNIHQCAISEIKTGRKWGWLV